MAVLLLWEGSSGCTVLDFNKRFRLPVCVSMNIHAVAQAKRGGADSVLDPSGKPWVAFKTGYE